MTIKIEIPAANTALAAAIGAALVAYGNGEAVSHLTVTTNTTTKTVGDASIKEEVKVATTADVVKAITKETGADNVVKLDSAKSHIDSTSSTAETLNQEQSSAGPDVGAAGNATAASGQPAGNDLNKLDEKGVGFNTEFCGNAAKPFYGPGKTKGQWKKRQGVDAGTYDAWYAESLAAIGSGSGSAEQGQKQQIDTTNAFNADGGQDQQPEINTGAAFAQQQSSHVNGQVANNGQSQQQEVAGAITFPDAGAYMKWQSEQQAAGNLTHGDVDSAYAATQVGIQDLFNPATAANAVAQMYNFLAPIAGGQ